MIGFILRLTNLSSDNQSDQEQKAYFLPLIDNQDYTQVTGPQFNLQYANYTFSENKAYQSESIDCFVFGKLLGIGDDQNSKSFASTIVKLTKSPHFLKELSQLNGAFTIILHYKEIGEIQIITDKMGFNPIYLYEDQEEIIISSFPDGISVSLEGKLELDEVSIAEYLKYGRIEFPNTYYTQIKQLSPGAVIRISKWKLDIKNYWSPTSNFITDSKLLYKELEQSIRTAVQDTFQAQNGHNGIFLSGGADSRGILFSDTNRVNLKSATFFDSPNDELVVAHQLANRAGIPHFELKRDLDHYARTGKLFSKVVQGMTELNCNHYLSFQKRIKQLSIDSWHSGCFADWFFKGLVFNTRFKSFFGKVLPTWKEFDAFHPRFYSSEAQISSPFSELVLDRIKNRYPNYSIGKKVPNQNLWELEVKRLWPINREVDFGSRLSLYQYFNWTPLFAHNDLIKVWQKIPPSQKLNGQIWKKAIAKICRGHNDIKDNNWGTPVGSNLTLSSIFFILEVLKRKIKRKQMGHSTTGSWPDFKKYLSTSKILPNDWVPPKEMDHQIIINILGYDPFKIPPPNWQNFDITLFYRIYTLNHWFKFKDNNFNI